MAFHSDPLFVSDNGLPVTCSWFQAQLKSLLTQMGIPADQLLYPLIWNLLPPQRLISVCQNTLSNLSAGGRQMAFTLTSGQERSGHQNTRNPFYPRTGNFDTTGHTSSWPSIIATWLSNKLVIIMFMYWFVHWTWQTVVTSFHDYLVFCFVTPYKG